MELKNKLNNKQSGGGAFCSNVNYPYPYQPNIMIGGGDVKGKTLMLFKAEWCPHCQNFKKEWEKLKKVYQGTDIEVKTFDSDADPEMMKKYDIKGYPTIMLETPEERKEYTGSRVSSEIEKFVKEN